MLGKARRWVCTNLRKHFLLIGKKHILVQSIIISVLKIIFIYFFMPCQHSSRINKYFAAKRSIYLIAGKRNAFKI